MDQMVCICSSVVKQNSLGNTPFFESCSQNIRQLFTTDRLSRALLPSDDEYFHPCPTHCWLEWLKHPFHLLLRQEELTSTCTTLGISCSTVPNDPACMESNGGTWLVKSKRLSERETWFTLWLHNMHLSSHVVNILFSASAQINR